MADTISTGQYAVLLYANDSMYILHNDGGHGPMSTGTNEWTKRPIHSTDIGKLFTKEKAIEIAKNPHIGWGKAPMPSKRIVMQVMLLPVHTETADPASTQELEERKRQAAIAKLTPEERQLLGIN